MEIKMNETLNTIHSLRTIHGNFSSQEIKDEDMKTILDACVRAANSSAKQDYSVIVVKDKKLMRELCGYVASRVLIFCVDYNRIIDTAKHMNHSYPVDSIFQFILGSTDTILAAQTAAIAAKSIGIDSLFTEKIYINDIPRTYELLDLPEKYCFPLIALVLGYPDQEPDHQLGRLNGAGVIHYDKYHKLTTEELDELVGSYDDPDNHMYFLDTWKKKSFDHYLDWFYKKWEPMLRHLKDKSQKAVLEEIGFIE
jgi:FMN reductase [NAD(P)H]